MQAGLILRSQLKLTHLPVSQRQGCALDYQMHEVMLLELSLQRQMVVENRDARYVRASTSACPYMYTCTCIHVYDEWSCRVRVDMICNLNRDNSIRPTTQRGRSIDAVVPLSVAY